MRHKADGQHFQEVWLSSITTLLALLNSCYLFIGAGLTSMENEVLSFFLTDQVQALAVVA